MSLINIITTAFLHWVKAIYSSNFLLLNWILYWKKITCRKKYTYLLLVTHSANLSLSLLLMTLTSNVTVNASQYHLQYSELIFMNYIHSSLFSFSDFDMHFVWFYFLFSHHLNLSLFVSYLNCFIQEFFF